MSCNICHNLEPVKPYSRRVNFKLLRLETSAGHGCPYCSIFYQAIVKFGFPSLAWSVESEASAFISSEGESLILLVNVVPGVGVERIEIYTLLEQPSNSIYDFKTIPTNQEVTNRNHGQPSSSIFGFKPTPPGNTASEESFFNVRAWLQACEHHHTACKPRSWLQLPRRLLSFQSTGGNVMLIEPKEGNKPAPYACLSHCWGTTQLLTTTIANLHQRKEGIPWDDLPRTFQDSIVACIKLGIGYLWIDSLCIIQDSEDDWHRESANMATIYGNAFLTIAASAAADSTEGCFRTARLNSYSIKVNKADGEEVSLYVRRSLPHFDHIHLMRDNNPWPLMRRAWAFQERLLSPRVLHYGPQELVWECREASRCECSNAISIPRQEPKIVWNSSSKPLRDVKSFAVWRHTVTEYTYCNLTFEKDRLPAIAGLAHQFRGLMDQSTKTGTYLAGIWSGDLVNELLWFRTIGDMSLRGYKPRPERYRTPTWTWAGTEGQVWFVADTWTNGFVQNVTIVDCACKPAGDDPYGPFQTGHLKLKGITLRFKLEYARQYMSLPRGEYALSSPYKLQGLAERNLWMIADYDIASQSVAQDASHVEQLGDVFAICIGAIMLPASRLVVLRTRICALILRKKIDDEADGHALFERIGLAFHTFNTVHTEEENYFSKGEEMEFDIV